MDKRKRGQPKKAPTFLRTIRMSEDLKDFLKSLSNANEFVVSQIINTDEYKDFIVRKEELSNSRTKSLFEGY